MNAAVLLLDMLGTFVFALSGATAGVMRRLDLFGVLVLSFAAATSGGILRDVLIGAVPPSGIADWRHLATSVIAGLVTFYGSGVVRRLHKPVIWSDAIGLSLFAVTGAAKAMTFGLHPVMAIVMGMLTGTGGGIVRDVLLREIPAVLRSEIYAVAALAGAAVFATAGRLNVPPAVAMPAGALVCFALRFMAIRHDWRLPTAGRGGT